MKLDSSKNIKSVQWEEIRAGYEQTGLSLRKLESIYHVPKSTIHYRAKLEHWNNDTSFLKIRRRNLKKLMKAAGVSYPTAIKITVISEAKEIDPIFSAMMDKELKWRDDHPGKYGNGIYTTEVLYRQAVKIIIAKAKDK